MGSSVLFADLPADFPPITVTTYDTNKVSEGYTFLAVASETEGIGTYLMILDNAGQAVWYQKVDAHEVYDLKVTPSGYLSYAPFIHAHSYTGGGDAIHEIRSSDFLLNASDDDTIYSTNSFPLIETVIGGNRYVAESHDFQLLPNGNILQFGYYMSEVDMSQIVDGGHPAAQVSGGVVQELDAQRNVVWQWRTWDHYAFEEATYTRGATSATISAWHLNTVNQDIDGQMILGTPGQIMKIDRQTGDVLWTLGGDDNEFELIGAEADLSHFGGHATYRIANGNFLMYDNGSRRGGGSSKVHEYTLDEINLTATHVWSWEPPTPIAAWHRGNAQRLPNGNTFIGWGGASGDHIPAATEVTPEGEIVFELSFDEADPQIESYRAVRVPYPPEYQKVGYMHIEVASGNDYDFDGTGVTIDINSRDGGGYNELTVTNAPYAPVSPVFSGKAPRILPVRVEVGEYAIDAIDAQISFDADHFGFSDPEDLTIYHRETPGEGLFAALATTYNPTTKKVRAMMTLFGEFVFGYPDLEDTAYPPILARVENDRGQQDYHVVAARKAEPGIVDSVNQELPIALSWSPKGFARWFELQIDTDEDFSSPEEDITYQTAGYYLWTDAEPNTTYSYRVRTAIEGGEKSDWSVGAFRTVPPAIEVTSPVGGEIWLPGESHYIRWNDNTADDVVIDLYQGETLIKTIATVPSRGDLHAFDWEVDLELEPAYDYFIKVSNSVDNGLADLSAQPFATAAPSIDGTSVARLENGDVVFTVSVPGATSATVHGSSDGSTWSVLGAVPVTDGSGMFTDDTADAEPFRFYTISVP